ncbi:MAG: hypothetical protein ABIS06_03640 [Vicinamibacterales bacterium]
MLDPANAGIANVKPASLTNGLTPLTASGDIANQVGQVIAGISGGEPTKPTLVVGPQGAIRLAALRDLGALGISIVVSSAAGNRLIGLDADGIVIADDGGAVDVGQPDIEMVDATTNPSTSATIMTSAWQRNLKVIRAERFVNWSRRADAASYLVLA